jgi:hypothetical protein
MGIETTVRFENGAVPSWVASRDFLQTQGFPVQIRMIDGELAFLDEVPPEMWRELRVGTANGMVTLRRENDRIAVVTWGNADAGMIQAWNALIWAIAKVGDGKIDSPDGPRTADEFRRASDLPAVLRGES